MGVSPIDAENRFLNTTNHFPNWGERKAFKTSLASPNPGGSTTQFFHRGLKYSRSEVGKFQSAVHIKLPQLWQLFPYPKPQHLGDWDGKKTPTKHFFRQSDPKICFHAPENKSKSHSKGASKMTVLPFWDGEWVSENVNSRDLLEKGCFNFNVTKTPNFGSKSGSRLGLNHLLDGLLLFFPKRPNIVSEEFHNGWGNSP